MMSHAPQRKDTVVEGCCMTRQAANLLTSHEGRQLTNMAGWENIGHNGFEYCCRLYKTSRILNNCLQVHLSGPEICT